ncbi:G patch domain-containing protein 1 homolog [Harpegnathos saltator]|uniref:G patch domain-containing protein 1-like protein n=1 Tax=Harpegnathos saltator TaxID=610380 RepID=E2BT53_HARSA|nr:G patch domain-containing protein 1 homolog [Harpegnathos saltator]EFN81127.1 G patch domain-containing protein 1-like protein [Harpegnathos saltator]
MSDSSDENYVTFGVALDPLDEENIPRKKPVTVEDQYAYDAQGRRRFHGAFTGGFSAGYFNTVGTRDGWRPQQFKSSRSSKADSITQRPEDFMDEEDTSLFGIAPKGIRATSDYADRGEKGKKRERISQDNSGPIPGTPVLKDLLKPVKETVGIVLLKKMGWKLGQGVGSRLTKREKHRMKQRNKSLKQTQENREIIVSNSEDSDDDFTDVTFAPDDYEPFRCKPKDNYFGIGYSGLDRRKVLSSHIDLFDTPAFCVQDKNKKLSIHGQAFGVGAFEADDDDIYEREDMSRYDFALGPEHKTKTRWSEDGPSSSQTDCLEGFVSAKERLESKKLFKPPELSKNFAPVHAVRKSRFYPPIATPSCTLENGKRRELNAVDRARILEDPDDRSKKPPSTSVASNMISRTLNLQGKQQTEEKQKLETQQTMKTSSSWLDKLNVQIFVKGGVVGSGENDTDNLKKLEDFTDATASTSSSTNKSNEDDVPDKSETKKLFLSDPDKQRRFEQYLTFLKNDELNKLESIQPFSMTAWEREQERTEFEQAAKLEQSSNYMANKFAPSVNHTVDELDPDKDKKEAVKLKMFGKLTRERKKWKPASAVCKRFNIPEPKVDCAEVTTDRKTAKFSIFDSLDWCSSSKFTKATDTVSKAQTEEPIPQSSRKTEEVHETAVSPKNIPSNIYQPSEVVSEKFRIFEASYEKVFGKGIQSAPSTTPKDTGQEHVADNSNKDKNTHDQETEDKRVVAGPANTFKNQSEEKKDLFKAIFLSSSEDSSDSESEENVDSEAVKSILIGKDSKEINTQRNTSPPRGIFAKLDLDSLLVQPKTCAKDDRSNESTASKVEETSSLAAHGSQSDHRTADRNNMSDTTEAAIPQDMYGPVLPQRLLKQESSATNANKADDDMTHLPKSLFRSVVVSTSKTDDSKFAGKWVERSKTKKSKKEKKKHKHKEHKSPKHKKKSKKEKRSRH